MCFWRGHSLCRAPLSTGVDIYPRVLPSACCVLLAGPLPLQGALNHWGRYLPQGPTICMLCASGGATPFGGATPLTTGVDIYPRVLPSACCVLLAGPLPSGGATPLTTGVDIYPRVLPSAYCVLLAGPLPLQGALNHWGRILPQGPTIQNNQLKKRVCEKY